MGYVLTTSVFLRPMCVSRRGHTRGSPVSSTIYSDLKVTPQENIKLCQCHQRGLSWSSGCWVGKSAIPHSSCWGEPSGEAEAPWRCEKRGGSLETGTDRLAWSSPGTRPEPELARGQGSQQTEVYSRHQLLGTATSNHSTGLRPQAADGGLGDQGGGGG